jgi:hypothetical protein
VHARTLGAYIRQDVLHNNGLSIIKLAGSKESESHVHAVGLSCNKTNKTGKIQLTNDRTSEVHAQAGHVGLERGHGL